MTSQSPSASVKIAAILFSILVALLFAEIALRVAGVSYPRWLQNDDLLGSVHRPGVSFRQKDEGNAVIRINSHGFRDRERSLTKPPRTVRIAVLGDSYVEAGQVDQEEMMTAVMERALNGCRAFGDSAVEVLNFGVTGYGTAQELLLLREQLWAWDPDIVVIGFLTGNDLRNNTARLHRDKGRPYFVYRDSVLVYDPSFRERYTPLQAVKRDVGHVLLDASRVVQVIYRAQGQAQKRRQAQARKEKAVENVFELGLDDQIYLPPTDPAWVEAWKITEELLRQVRDEVKAHDKRLLVAVLSNAAQVDPDPAVRAKNLDRIGTTHFFYPDERLVAFGAREGISVLPVAPLLQEIAERENVHFHGFPGQNLGTGHWNVEGHRVAGLLVAERIAREFGTVACPADLGPMQSSR